jgi:hypothetical protein
MKPLYRLQEGIRRVAVRRETRAGGLSLRRSRRWPPLPRRARLDCGRPRRDLVAPRARFWRAAPARGLIPDNVESAQVAQRDAEIFSVPLTTDTLVVQRDSNGLSATAQARAVARAAAVSQGPKQPEGIQVALPIANTLGFFPSSREHGTTAITYLYFGPEASLSDRVAEAKAYASRIPPQDSPVGFPRRLPSWADSFSGPVSTRRRRMTAWPRPRASRSRASSLRARSPWSP